MLVRYSPRTFQPSLSLMDDMRRTFGLLFDDLDGSWAGAPRFDTTTKEDGLELRAEVPGLAPDLLSVTVDAGNLVIETKVEAAIPEGYRVHRQERTPSQWKRTFALPYEVDADQVKAKLEHGILELWLPKAARIKPRQITIG
jgi:HSP20 family protein